MRNFLPGMPPPTIGGMLFNMLMLAAPLIGLWLGGPIGVLIGMSVASIGWVWFFFIYGRRKSHCARCGRPLLNLGRSAFGAMRTHDAMMGLERLGDECQSCGRIYCSYCAGIDTTCVCGSSAFHTIRLHYG